LQPPDPLPPAASGRGRDWWLKGRIFAHRGLHGAHAPENSPTGFAAAIAQGLGIECDVRLSKDGRAVVFHDERLERLTAASGCVVDRSAEDLAAIPLRGGADRIPLLSDLLAQVAGAVPLLIEIKSSRGHAIAPLCAAVRGDLAGYAGQHAVMSFDPRVGAWFARHAPGTVRGLVVTEEGRRTLRHRIARHFALWRARAEFLAYDVRDLPSAFAAARRRRGLPVLAWTVRTAALRQIAALHADAPIAEAEGLAHSHGNP